MKFTPKSEQEIGSSGLWPAGTYDFEVNSAEEKTSKSGNDMVQLTLHVFNDAGSKTTVFDYLVGTEAAQFKVRGFAAAVGLLEAYETGELDALDMEGRTGKCKLAIEKDKTGQFPDKNTVAAYLPAEDAGTAPKAGKPRSVAKRPAGPSWDAPKGRDLDDEIPF